EEPRAANTACRTEGARELECVPTFVDRAEGIADGDDDVPADEGRIGTREGRQSVLDEPLLGQRPPSGVRLPCAPADLVRHGSRPGVSSARMVVAAHRPALRPTRSSSRTIPSRCRAASARAVARSCGDTTCPIAVNDALTAVARFDAWSPGLASSAASRAPENELPAPVTSTTGTPRG